jgi:hypothetical protein
MALVGMPRGNATAWVSKPRHRSPPIRPGENNPGPDHGFKILRPGNLSRARHTSPPGKRGEADLKNDLQPVAATTRHRLHLPSRKPTNQEVQISARPNRNSRSGRHPHAQIQPSEKIKKTTCFDLILLTPETPPRRTDRARLRDCLWREGPDALQIRAESRRAGANREWNRPCGTRRRTKTECSAPQDRSKAEIQGQRSFVRVDCQHVNSSNAREPWRAGWR